MSYKKVDVTEKYFWGKYFSVKLMFHDFSLIQFLKFYDYFVEVFYNDR